MSQPLKDDWNIFAMATVGGNLYIEICEGYGAKPCIISRP